MPFTSSDEITTAVKSVVQDALTSKGESDWSVSLHHALILLATRKLNQLTYLWVSEITEKDIDAHLMTSKVGSPPLDIWIRTSGVKRLSDYLIWQVRLRFPCLLPWRFGITYS